MNYLARSQSGYSLLEVLVSVVVLSVGLLGIAALQVNSVRYNHSAYLRSIATAQATNMADRMRGNYAGVKAGYYNAISGIPSANNCTTCSTADIATLDAFQWNSDNASLLPLGQGTVVKNGSKYIITIRWDNNRTGATGLGCSGNAGVDLTCFPLEIQL